MSARVLLRLQHNVGLRGRARSRVRRIGFVILFVVLGVAFAAAQSQTPVDAKPALDAREYETQQRARRLLQMDAEIRTLPDVEIRGQLRLTILEFVYSQEARSEYPAAELLMTAFFEDIAANEKQVGDRSWRNSLVITLRKHAPETAKKIEAKYVLDVDTSGDDLGELRRQGVDQKAIVDRAVERVRTGKNIWGVLNIFETVKRTDKLAAERILLAVLDRVEKYPAPDTAGLLNRLIVEPLNPPPLEVSSANMLRYYRCLVAAARIELADAKPDAYLYTLSPLRRALPKIRDLDDQLYTDARSIITRYRTTLSKDALAKDEAAGRIEASDDKLKQAIAEAEAATAQNVTDYLWGWAASLAGLKGDYRQAVDLMMKTAPDLGSQTRPKGRDDLLAGVVRYAYQKKDYDAANYAIDHIEDRLVRAKAMLELGHELGSWDANKRDQAIAITTNGLDLMEMLDPDPDSICTVGNTRHLLTYSRQRHMTMEEFTPRVVSMINRIPTPGADSKAGTPERAEFVLRTLSRALPCVGYVFRPVVPGSPIPNPELASHIKVKEWRLAAEIEAEKNRKYPLPTTTSESTTPTSEKPPERR